MTLNVINKAVCTCRLCGKLIQVGEYKAVSSRHDQAAHKQCYVGEGQAWSIERQAAKDGNYAMLDRVMLKDQSLVGTFNNCYKVMTQGKLSVIAFSVAKQEYCVWSYEILEDGKASYFWGRYVSTFHEAQKRHKMKENGEYSG